MTLARALARSFKLPDRVPQSPRQRTFGGLGGLLGGSAQSGMEAYTSVGAVYGPTRRICEAVSLVQWSLYQQTVQQDAVKRELLDDCVAPARHPATALLLHPNDHMTLRLFFFLTQLWLETANGQCYWLLCQRDAPSDRLTSGLQADLELWPIRPDRITPIPDPDAYIAGYVYTLGTEKIPLPVQAVVPLGYPSPLDPLRGAGPLQSVLSDIQSERYASDYQRNVFLNDAQPGGVIQFDTPLSQDRFEELVLRWREQHQGVSNAKRVAIIEGGQWVSTSQTNREMEYSKLRQVNREEIMFALGMPFAMMQTTDVNLANATMAEKLFYRWTVRPKLEAIKEALNERVAPYLGDNLTYDYALPSPEDEAFDVFSGISGWLGGVTTQNEARSAMGYDAIPEGDRYVFDLPNVAPTQPAMMPARPPRRPTNLAYDGGSPTGQGTALTERLESVRTAYEGLLRQRNGHGR